MTVIRNKRKKKTTLRKKGRKASNSQQSTSVNSGQEQRCVALVQSRKSSNIKLLVSIKVPMANHKNHKRKFSLNKMDKHGKN